MRHLAMAGALLLVPSVLPPQQNGGAMSSAELYRTACAACHGNDGRGAPKALVGFETPLPDFTSCSFATREPDADWGAITHAGGRVRGFSRMMPAFGAALTPDEIQRVLSYIRQFCASREWPRGELNLPRPLFTEKAYPEDETVLTFVAPIEQSGPWDGELVYERRFGPQNQIEVALPFGTRQRANGSWVGGIGDVALGVKRALHHSLTSGRIFSVAAEIILPTGNVSDDFGAGTTIVEPFIAFGQILPAASFFQLQAGAELQTDRERDDEAFWRVALGRSFAEGRFGRSWSPMVELLGARDLASGATMQWHIVPQLQVTLSRRQHIMANLGFRFPLTGHNLQSQAVFYLLWDWFDGGLLEGW